MVQFAVVLCRPRAIDQNSAVSAVEANHAHLLGSGAARIGTYNIEDLGSISAYAYIYNIPHVILGKSILSQPGSIGVYAQNMFSLLA